MRELLAIIGLVSLVFGITMLFFPKQLAELADKVNKVVGQIDEGMLRLRIGLGVSLLAIGAVCFFLVYYIASK